MNAIRPQTVIYVALLLTCLFIPLPTLADVLTDARIKERTDAILGLMSFMLTPDVTTGSLSVNNEPTGNPDIFMVTVGGGFTTSQDFPLYLEGTLGYSRYDPIFLASDGLIERLTWSRFLIHPS